MKNGANRIKYVLQSKQKHRLQIITTTIVLMLNSCSTRLERDNDRAKKREREGGGRE